MDLLVKKHKDWHDVIPILNKAIDAENRKRKEAKDADSFYPNPKNLQTYINNRSWELFTDEPDYDENEYHPNTNGSDVRWNEPSQDIYAFIRGLLIIFVMDIQKILDRIMQQYFVRDGNMYGIRNNKNGIMINGR